MRGVERLFVTFLVVEREWFLGFIKGFDFEGEKSVEEAAFLEEREGCGVKAIELFNFGLLKYKVMNL